MVSMKKSGENWALRLSDDIEAAMVRLRAGLLSSSKGKAQARITSIKVLGYIPQGKDLTFVIYRMTHSIAGIPLTKVALWEVQKSDPAWAWVARNDRAALTADLKKDFRVGQ